MALIHDSIGCQDEDSGWARVFGHSQLGKLLSCVHVCSIRNDYELAELLWQSTPHKSTLSEILMGGTSAQPVKVATAKGIRRASRDIPLIDFLILDHERRDIAAVELKDGDTFDMKKANGELASARAFTEWLRPRVGYPVRYYFCAFNQASRMAIAIGMKGRLTPDEVLTGRELCERMSVDYDAIRVYRQAHQEANRIYFVEQLLAIPEMRVLVEQLWGSE